MGKYYALELVVLGSQTCRVTRREEGSSSSILFVKSISQILADDKEVLSPSTITIHDGDIIEPYERPLDCTIEEAKSNGVYHPFKVNICSSDMKEFEDEEIDGGAFTEASRKIDMAAKQQDSEEGENSQETVDMQTAIANKGMDNEKGEQEKEKVGQEEKKETDEREPEDFVMHEAENETVPNATGETNSNAVKESSTAGDVEMEESKTSKQMGNDASANPGNDNGSKEPFIASKTFEGVKPGYAFRTSEKFGTGYHIDERPQFIASKTFQGIKPGYTFRSCEKFGLGYHLDQSSSATNNSNGHKSANATVQSNENSSKSSSVVDMINEDDSSPSSEEEEYDLDDPRQEIIDILHDIETPGSFAVSGSCEGKLIMPGLVVDKVGSIGLPISQSQAKELAERCEQAPFGRGADTIVDKSVRNTFQLAPEHFKITNPSWKKESFYYDFFISTSSFCSLCIVFSF